MRDADDGELAARASRGDRAALEQLLDRHADRIHALCRRIIAHPEDALDATQEAMIAVVRGIRRFDGRSRVHDLAVPRRHQRRARRAAAQAAAPGSGRAPRTARSGAPADAQVDARLDIDAALAKVPEEFRVAVVLRDLCDLDYAEIASVLDIPAGTVRSRISPRARRARRGAREPRTRSRTSHH